MAKSTGTKKRVVKNSAKTGNFSHEAARAAARKVAQKRTSSNGRSKASK